MRFRELAAAVGIGAALLVAGCGGDGGDDAPTLATADQNQLVRAADQINQAIEDKDGASFCDVMQPSLVDDVFGSVKGCIKRAVPALKSSGLTELDIESMKATDTGATLEFKQAPGREITFIKEDGNWYLDLTASVPAEPTGSNPPATPDSESKEKNGK